MRVLMSYCAKDYNLAFSALSILLQKTDIDPSLLYAYGSRHGPDLPRELEAAGITFIRSRQDNPGYPLGANFMFAGMLGHAVENAWTEPMFLCEPDGFPTCRDWYDRIKASHERTKAMVSGSYVDWVKPKHLNGNLVINPLIVAKHPCLTRITHDPWDCFHAETLLENGALNLDIHNPKRLIKHYPTDWWFAHKVAGKTPAWIHGCQNFQCWEHIERDGLDE